MVFHRDLTSTELNMMKVNKEISKKEEEKEEEDIGSKPGGVKRGSVFGKVGLDFHGLKFLGGVVGGLNNPYKNQKDKNKNRRYRTYRCWRP